MNFFKQKLKRNKLPPCWNKDGYRIPHPATILLARCETLYVSHRVVGKQLGIYRDLAWRYMVGERNLAPRHVDKLNELLGDYFTPYKTAFYSKKKRDKMCQRRNELRRLEKFFSF